MVRKPDNVIGAARALCYSDKKIGDGQQTIKIEELIYLGDHIRCRMNVAGDDQFIMKVVFNTSSAFWA